MIDPWLVGVLSNGERLATDVEAAAAEAGFTPKQVRSARERLGVEMSRAGDRRSRWNLPGATGPAAGARGWISDRVTLGQMGAEEAQVHRWLVDAVGDGERRRIEIEAQAGEQLIDEELLDAAGEMDREGRRAPYRRALLATLTLAGLRIDEALSLRWRCAPR